MTLGGDFPERDLQDSGWSGRGDRNVIALLTEMVMLPVTAFLYGIELLVRAMQGTQNVTEHGMNVMVGAPRTRASEALRDRDLLNAGNGGQRTTSGSDGGPEPRPAQKEAAAMDTSIGYESRRDRDLRDDTLKLVRYKILFVKREYEVAFPEQEDLVYDNMDPTSFAAWKVAEFVQRMHREGVRQPDGWVSRGYPARQGQSESDRRKFDRFFHRECVLKSLPEDDKKYLRVYYEVLERYPREKFRHEEQQIRVLEQIRDKMMGTIPEDPDCSDVGPAQGGARAHSTQSSHSERTTQRTQTSETTDSAQAPPAGRTSSSGGGDWTR